MTKTNDVKNRGYEETSLNMAFTGSKSDGGSRRAGYCGFPSV